MVVLQDVQGEDGEGDGEVNYRPEEECAGLCFGAVVVEATSEVELDDVDEDECCEAGDANHACEVWEDGGCECEEY